MIEGRRVAGPGHPAAARAAGLALACRRLTIAGPDTAAFDRMAQRFRQYRQEDRRRGWAPWLAAWFGAGPRPRNAFQRLAAGTVLLAAAGTSGSVAAGYPPGQIVAGVRDFTRNAVMNLSPRNDIGGSWTPLLEATPPPSGLESPAGQAAAPSSAAGAPSPSPESHSPAGAVPPTNSLSSPTATATPTPTPAHTPTPIRPPQPSPTPTRAGPIGQPPVVEGPDPPPPSLTPTPSPTAGPSVTPSPTPTEDVEDDAEDHTSVEDHVDPEYETETDA